MKSPKTKEKDQEEMRRKETREVPKEKVKENDIFQGYKLKELLELGENVRNKRVNVLINLKRNLS